MAVTRAKATALLNKTEMGLYDDSRANALRGHSESRLAQLVSRARTARDRARDLEKRQRLESRKTSGSKSGRTGVANARTGEKGELLADILSRFETRQREAAKAAETSAKRAPAKATAPKRSAAKAAKAAGKNTRTNAAKSAAVTKTTKPAKKATTAKKAALPATAEAARKVAKKTAPKTAKAASTKNSATAAAARAAKKPVAKKATATQSTAGQARAPATAAKPAGRSATKAVKTKAPADKVRKASNRGKRAITPEQALENTRRLLEQHEAEAKASKPWETLGTAGAAPDAPGFQSPQARSKALALHEAETRQASINGSVSTRDRRNQGKRDHRSD